MYVKQCPKKKCPNDNKLALIHMMIWRRLRDKSSRASSKTLAEYYDYIFLFIESKHDLKLDFVSYR